tara:strand:+ start:524 stop:1474 length:951 start_codon:yes stop_codon:yes gene_type:complete
MSRIEYEFNTKNNDKSWNINAYKISSIDGDDLILQPSANNNIINIGNIVPGSSNSYDLGNRNSIIRNIYVNKVIGDVSGNLYGNALTSTKLEKTIKIGGMDFDGRNDIMLPGVNVPGNQDTGGNAGSATRLRNGKKIGGVEFTGLNDINLPGVNIAGNQDTTGNAGSATKLKTAVRIQGISFDGTTSIWLPELRDHAISADELSKKPTIGGVIFDGSSNIDLPGVNILGNQDTTGNANSANTAISAGSLIVDGSYANILLIEDDIYYQGLSHNFVGDLSGSTISELKQKVESLEIENELIKNKLNALLTLQGLTNI